MAKDPETTPTDPGAGAPPPGRCGGAVAPRGGDGAAPPLGGDGAPAAASRPHPGPGPGQCGAAATATPKARFSAVRLIPLLILVAGLAAFFAFGLHDYLTFGQLKAHRAALNGWVADNAILAPLLFALGYAVIVALSLPIASLATLVGGFLFGVTLGSVIVIVSATLGATALFLAAKTALGDWLRDKAGRSVQRMEKGFREDAFSYLLVLRLVPLFPFFLVNLAPAFLGVSTRVFVLATFFGIIPGSIVYVSVGNGLGAVFDAGGTPDLGIVFKPEILLPLLGLAVLAMVPVVYKRLRRRRGG